MADISDRKGLAGDIQYGNEAASPKLVLKPSCLKMKGAGRQMSFLKLYIEQQGRIRRRLRSMTWWRKCHSLVGRR